MCLFATGNVIKKNNNERNKLTGSKGISAVFSQQTLSTCDTLKTNLNLYYLKALQQDINAILKGNHQRKE